MGLMIAFFLKDCPRDLAEEWQLPSIQHPSGEQQGDGTPMFSGPALISMQSQLPGLAVTPIDHHIPYLNQVHQHERRQAESIHQNALEAQLERQKALLERKNKDGSPKKMVIRSQVEVTRERTDEEQKLRKVVQHELNHYNLANPSDPTSPRKRQKPVIPMTPPASPPSDLVPLLLGQNPSGTSGNVPGLKSILKVSTVPEDIPANSPLKQITIQKTASAKLNYLLDQILKLHKDEKIIVFSDYAPVMWYLGESLEILGIPHLIYIQKLVIPPSSSIPFSPPQPHSSINYANADPWFRCPPAVPSIS